MKWNMLWDLSVHKISLQFEDTFLSLTNHKRKRVCIFLHHEPWSKATMGVVLFSLLFIQQFNSMLSTNSTTFDTSSTPTSVDSLSKIVMFLFLSTRGILGDSCLPWEPLLPMVLHLHRFLSRHLHLGFQLAQCHHQLQPDLVQSFRWTYERIALPYSFLGC